MPAVHQILLARRKRTARNPSRLTRNLIYLTVAFFVIVSSLLALTAIAGTLLFAGIIRDLPPVESFPVLFEYPDGLILKPTRIYDRSGEHLIATLENPAARSRDYLFVGEEGPNNFPSWLVQATIAAQDPGFWEHPGFSLGELRTENHPTLAQQLVADYLLWDENPSIQRAIRERILAGQATARYGRGKIVEWYLNSADYGNLAFGADAAARTYFGKSAADLSLPESAMLAAIAVTPALNPIDAPQAARENMVALLDEMNEQGLIAPDQLSQAKRAVLTLQTSSDSEDDISSAFTSFVTGQLSEMFPGDRILLGGFRVISTMDYDLQVQAACTASFQVSRIVNGEDSPISDQQFDGCEASRLLPTIHKQVDNNSLDLGVNVVALTPDSGQVLAIVAEGRQLVDVSIMSGRPPGTLLTPFIYLSAFTRGLNPGSLLWDTPASLVEGATDVITSPDGKYHGPVRARTALANDYLVPTIKLLDQIGPAQVWRTAQQLGLRRLEVADEFGSLRPSLHSGLRLPFEGGNATLLEISQAYGVFANLGILSGVIFEDEAEISTSSIVHPLGILEVSDYSGKPWLDCTGQLGGCLAIKRPLITTQLAYLITNILSDETSRWPSLGHPNALETGFPTGAKIGRTMDRKDSWTVGFTTDLVIGVWIGPVGPEDTNEMEKEIPIEDEWSAGLWHALIQHATRGIEVSGWIVPPGITKIDVCDPSGLLPTADCPEIVTEVFTNGSEPTHTDTLFRSLQINRESGQLATIFTPPELIESQVFMVVPDEAISWALDAGLSIPPDTYDNIEAPPQVNPNAQIVSPSLFNHVNGKVPIIGRAAGANFDYYRLQVGKGLNPTTWTQLGDDQRNPVGDGQLGVWDTRGLDGLYVLQLLVVQNSNEVETSTLQVSVDNQSPQIAIRFPSEGETLDAQGDGTITLEADASDELGVANVEFFIDEEQIASLNSLPYAFLWEMTVGRHTFTARATDRAGNVTESSIQFSVE